MYTNSKRNKISKDNFLLIPNNVYVNYKLFQNEIIYQVLLSKYCKEKKYFYAQ